ncbi:MULTISPECIES: TauD/TfdA family dioxygenase [unclassified Beijerinckia]|uniref:TauD/TfdA dioxygenase family protein n=1 Tax=unclassified Beijerinckia TaxID=2638183 RepID=UPI00089D1550|nr:MULTISPECIES: TauD/TfdA family dioxygenase [unclassified Beijerinckia]MDH7798689.1 taurine dioxygenase [Beijerinckia sp. GAS462]SED29503.1 taurine dioxygenase [Beijerinckia sp. 28-YEA-48]
MSDNLFSVKQTSPHVGAEISGLDLTQPLSDAASSKLRHVLAEHGVLFFRDQQLTPDTLKRLGAQFGDLTTHALKGMPGHPEVRNIYADEKSKHVSGEDWHTDMSCNETPPLGSILCIQILPDIGGDTIFSSMYAAYEALSDRMKAYLEGLTATHDGAKAFRRFDPNGKFPIATHPVIKSHPENGRKLIYVNRGFTSHINELPPAESDNLLTFLFNHCEKPDYSTRFHWEKNSVAFWDNRCTQHLAVWDYFPNKRSGIRVQIEQ